jgi:hypothetical protein
MFTALPVSHFDIVLNSVQRWDCEVGVFCCKEVDELGIGGDVRWAVAFGYPFCDVGADVCESKMVSIVIMYILELRA